MAGHADEETYASVDLVCALCDNGGEIASCEGRCLRSFHATKDSGEDCPTLGYSRQQFNAIKVFRCKNCEYERYQCFACGRLGSAKTDSPEVFPCASAICGYFYHAKCVAQLLFPENDAKANEYTAKIANGSKFACPLHKCDICKYGENKEIKELQFAVCRRCPKAYHRRCLPRKIAFEDFTENGQCVFQRAWDDLLPNNRILIYCLKHDIDPKCRTPTRNHIKFPEDPAAIKKPLNYANGMNKKMVRMRRIDDLPSAPLPSFKRSSGTVKRSSLSNLMNKRRKVPVSGEKTTVMEKPVVMSKLPFSSFPEIDRYTEMRIYEFAQKTSASITMEDVQKKLVVPSTHTSMHSTDKITLGMVERTVEAVKAALYMLENGASIEDAKSVCAPSDLFQLAKWKNKLNIFLAPFLHGMRYTSYGRHFTKLDKLQLIVDKLQWYIQSGDTIVDFCCGSNDFSLLLKEKLEDSGKNCFYKNFDLIQPKNDFSFERRDWMTVQPDELPTGCRLIMGLNPPFGFKASLANQFINKALTFKPKLIILIVPKETERLDKKYPPYELIWQDSQQLAGKSFYLPGSLDADNKVMEQWNMSPPPLSLWSRSDWAKRHSDIAKSMGHLPSENAFSDDCQRAVADGPPVPTSGHVEMDALDQLLSDTYHDPTSSPGDYWNDTNGRSRQPCNYETRGRSDPTYPHHSYMGAGSDMSISLSETDCERQDQASSISEHEGIDSQACNAVGSALAEEPAAASDYAVWSAVEEEPTAAAAAAADYAVWSAVEEEPTAAADYAVGNASEEEPTAAADYAVGSAPEEEPTAAAYYAVGSALEEEPITTADYVVGSAPEEESTAFADCNEVTSAASPYHLLEDSSQAVKYAAGVQYWRMEDSPLLEEGELSDSPPVGRPAAGAEYQGMKDTPPAVTPEADSHSQSGQPDDSPTADLRPAARHNARTLPPRNTFPGLRFRPGCNSSRQFMSQSMSHPAVHQGPSNGWIDDDDY